MYHSTMRPVLVGSCINSKKEGVMRRYYLILICFLVVGAVTAGCGTVYKVAVDK